MTCSGCMQVCSQRCRCTDKVRESSKSLSSSQSDSRHITDSFCHFQDSGKTAECSFNLLQEGCSSFRISCRPNMGLSLKPVCVQDGLGSVLRRGLWCTSCKPMMSLFWHAAEVYIRVCFSVCVCVYVNEHATLPYQEMRLGGRTVNNIQGGLCGQNY